MDFYKSSYNGDEKYYNTVRGKLKQKRFNMKTVDFNVLLELAANYYPKDRYQIQFLSELRTALDQYISSSKHDDRKFIDVLGGSYDVYFPIDAMGRAYYSNKKTLVVSIKDSLDLVLNSLCGVPIESVRNIENYKLLSRCILSLYRSPLRGLSLDVLLGAHPILDSYIKMLYATSSTPDEFKFKFMEKILKEANKLLHQYASMFRSIIDDDGKHVVLRSYNLCNVILGTDDDGFSDNRFFISDDYCLLVKSYDRDAYIDSVGEECSLYLGGA